MSALFLSTIRESTLPPSAAGDFWSAFVLLTGTRLSFSRHPPKPHPLPPNLLSVSFSCSVSCSFHEESVASLLRKRCFCSSLSFVRFQRRFSCRLNRRIQSVETVVPQRLPSRDGKYCVRKSYKALENPSIELSHFPFGIPSRKFHRTKAEFERRILTLRIVEISHCPTPQRFDFPSSRYKLLITRDRSRSTELSFRPFNRLENPVEISRIYNGRISRWTRCGGEIRHRAVNRAKRIQREKRGRARRRRDAARPLDRRRGDRREKKRELISVNCSELKFAESVLSN